MLKTTTVGSFPKSEELKSARAKVRRRQMDPAELISLEEAATREWIRIQEEIGLDILVDGEQYRGDMATYFAEHLGGFSISSLVRSYGNRYYRKPIAVRKIQWKGPITVDWFKFAQGLTRKPVKGMLTGPYTMMDWSFDEHYPNRRAFCLDLARAIHEEVKALEAAGARFIQIDEPAVSTRTEEIELAVEAMRIVTEGVRVQTGTHICYGDFEKVYPQILGLAVDQIDLEFTNSNFALLDLIRKIPFTKEVGFGVVDVHSHRVESVDEIKGAIRRGLEVFPPEKLYVDPDCGLKTRLKEEAVAKLTHMVAAVREVRRELGAEAVPRP
ncbi:MAG: methionine synthase [Candidatus Omnitrophica bacterium]|nr:methionine synthase [Candidatus Omnitrophota bacterium]